MPAPDAMTCEKLSKLIGTPKAPVGRDGMGALTYRPADEPEQQEEISLDWFDRLVPEVGGVATVEDLERLRHMAGIDEGDGAHRTALVMRGPSAGKSPPAGEDDEMAARNR